MREVIAEVATNHGGDLSIIKEFIDAFAPHVDTIKFQLTRSTHLRAGDPQTGWFKRSELSLDQWAEAKRLCEARRVGFLLTCYNAADVWELVELGCRRVKIGSGEAREPDLATAVRRAKLKPLVSCGIRRPHPMWGLQAQFLGCVSRYPAPPGLAPAILLHRKELAGWSDHAEGLREMQAAWVAGAKILETHVCIGHQARPIRPFEKRPQDMADFRAWTLDDPRKYLGRWQA